MSPGGATWKKQSDPRELSTLLWLTLADGAAGALFGQYRPECLSFESPGYNLVALDGQPTPRIDAASRAAQQIKSLSEHLPLACPRAEVGIVYHPESQEIFTYNREADRFLADLRGVCRTLWTHGIQADVITPRMDWSGYRLLFLPNVTLMNEERRPCRTARAGIASWWPPPIRIQHRARGSARHLAAALEDDSGS